jgi:hypothetical protein
VKDCSDIGCVNKKLRVYGDCGNFLTEIIVSIELIEIIDLI